MFMNKHFHFVHLKCTYISKNEKSFYAKLRHTIFLYEEKSQHLNIVIINKTSWINNMLWINYSSEGKLIYDSWKGTKLRFIIFTMFTMFTKTSLGLRTRLRRTKVGDLPCRKLRIDCRCSVDVTACFNLRIQWRRNLFSNNLFS